MAQSNIGLVCFAYWLYQFQDFGFYYAVAYSTIKDSEKMNPDIVLLSSFIYKEKLQQPYIR